MGPLIISNTKYKNRERKISFYKYNEYNNGFPNKITISERI